MEEKTVGYILLAVGILFMAVSVYLIFLVLTERMKPFQVFKADQVQRVQSTNRIEDLMSDPASLAQMQSQILSNVLDKQINKTMNVGVTIFMMYFLMLFGFRVSTLGVQLVRPIHVDLKTSSVPKPPQDVT